MKTDVITLRVPAEIKQRFAKLASDLGQSPSEVGAHILAEWANNPTQKAVFDLLSRGPESAALVVLHKANLEAFNKAADTGKMSEATVRAWGAFMHSLASDMMTDIKAMQKEAREASKVTA